MDVKGFVSKYRVFRLINEIVSLVGLNFWYLKWIMIENRFPKDGLVENALNFLGRFIEEAKQIKE